ncbi:fumarylacetoacetate hydrolase family protein [Celeribacter sp. SCSIO 80788]|uniref:fumarylacetoacetate hydrolase family protein n=1 Tax=Celeribacter sp. SCSIO 80788 TaxID=3117013 RepID=UPI003DA5F21F
MKLCRFAVGGEAHLGVIDGETIFDLTAAGYGTSMRAFLAAGYQNTTLKLDASVPLAGATLLAPIDDPEKFIALGMNYKEHADGARAAGIPVPNTQIWFNKQVSCINAPYAGFEMPRVSDRLDYEAELAIVIGKTCRHVKPEEVRDVIAGYMVANDVSVRDWQLRSPTFTLGKSFDTHGPIGPWITTDDEIADPQKLAIKAWVNGDLRQDSNTDDMIYSIADQISYISQAFTLKPGDVLLTGTPAGVGIETDRYLSVGDVVKIEIEGLGHIENTVMPEPAA